MASAGSFPIEVVLRGLDLLSAPMAQAARSMDRLAQRSEALKKIGGGLSTAGRNVAVAGAAVGAAVGVAANAYMDLEKAQVQAVNAFSTNGGLSKHWAEINRQAIEAGDLYPGTSADFIKMAASLKRAGMSAEDMAGGGFKAAAALQVLMADVPPDEAGRMFQVMSNAMGLAGKDAGYFADQLQRVAYATPLTIQGAAEAFKYVGAGLKKMKIQGRGDTDLVLATMGALKQTGLDDSQVGTAMGQFLEKMALAQARIAGGDTRGAAMKAAFQGLQESGVDLQFFGADKQFLGLDNALGQLSKMGRMSDLQKSIAGKALFGQEGQRLLTGAGLEQLNTVIRKMRDQEDIQKRLARITGTLTNQWESLKGTTTNFLAAAAAPMAKDLEDLAGRANALVSRLKAWTDAHPDLTRRIGKLALGLAALGVSGGAALWVAGKLISAWGSAIVVVPKLALALKALAVANPWVLALVAGGALLASRWDTVGPIMGRVADSLGNVVENVAGLIGNQAALFGFADKAASKFDALGKVAWSLAKAIEIIGTGVEAVSAVMRYATPTWAMADPLRQIGATSGAAIDTFRGTKGSFWDRVKAANAAGGKAATAASGESVDRMLRPFEGIAARDPLGVGGALDRGIQNFNRGREVIAGAMSTTIQVNVPAGSPAGLAETIATAVDQRVRARATEYARILQGGAAVGNRGQYAAQGVN